MCKNLQKLFKNPNEKYIEKHLTGALFFKLGHEHFTSKTLRSIFQKFQGETAIIRVLEDVFHLRGSGPPIAHNPRG